MNTYDIIMKKRDGHVLDKDEIVYQYRLLNSAVPLR